MLAADRCALVCDLAETYGIFDMRALPVELLAALSSGLRENSRIKQKIAGVQGGIDTLLLAAAVDRLSLLVWAQSEAAQEGTGRPNSILAMLTETEQPQSAVQAFDSAEEYEAAKRRILEGVNHGN